MYSEKNERSFGYFRSLFFFLFYLEAVFGLVIWGLCTEFRFYYQSLCQYSISFFSLPPLLVLYILSISSHVFPISYISFLLTNSRSLSLSACLTLVSYYPSVFLFLPSPVEVSALTQIPLGWKTITMSILSFTYRMTFYSSHYSPRHRFVALLPHW